MTHPDLERVLSGDYVHAAATVDLETLYRYRTELYEVEGQLSFVRRVAQGRIDILCTELERRDAGGDPDDLGDLIRRLPDVFGGPGVVTTARGAEEVSPDERYLVPVDSIADAGLFLALPEHTDSDLDALVVRLEAAENDISEQRRTLHEAIDAVQCEIARRYRGAPTA